MAAISSAFIPATTAKTKTTLTPHRPITNQVRMFDPLESSGGKEKFQRVKKTGGKNVRAPVIKKAKIGGGNVEFESKSTTGGVKNVELEGKPSTGDVKNVEFEGKPSTGDVKNVEFEGKPSTGDVKNVEFEGKPSTGDVKNVELEGKPSTGDVKNVEFEGKPTTGGGGGEKVGLQILLEPEKKKESCFHILRSSGGFNLTIKDGRTSFDHDYQLDTTKILGMAMVFMMLGGVLNNPTLIKVGQGIWALLKFLWAEKTILGKWASKTLGKK